MIVVSIETKITVVGILIIVLFGVGYYFLSVSTNIIDVEKMENLTLIPGDYIRVGYSKMTFVYYSGYHGDVYQFCVTNTYYDTYYIVYGKNGEIVNFDNEYYKIKVRGASYVILESVPKLSLLSQANK